MVNALVVNFLRGVPEAAAIWSSLIVLTMVLLAAVIARPERDRPIREPVEPAPPAPAPPDPEDLSRYAGEVAVAAGRAAVTALRRRSEWLAAQEEVESTWAAYRAAEAAARRLAAAAALPAPRTPRTPAEYADRERYLHRAAMAAYWRGEFSLTELSDVLVHRNGWDPRRHPVEQELVLASAVRDVLWARHRAATQRERVAWRDAEVAAAAARSLRDEAFGAAVRAHQARHPMPVRRARTRPAAEPVRRLLPVARWRTVRAG